MSTKERKEEPILLKLTVAMRRLGMGRARLLTMLDQRLIRFIELPPLAPGKPVTRLIPESEVERCLAEWTKPSVHDQLALMEGGSK